MIRPLFAALGALALLTIWLALIAVQAKGDPASCVSAIGDSASRAHLPGLAARAYLFSANLLRRRLYSPETDRESAVGKELIRQIIARRMAAARLLLQSGYVAAAERIALDGARADFDDLQARALLLEVRLHGNNTLASRRDLMLMLLSDEHPQLLCLLGTSFAREGRVDDAAGAYERALSLDADHVPTLVALAELRAKQGDPTEAQTLLQRAASTVEAHAERELVNAASRRLQMAPGSALPRAIAWCYANGGFLIAVGLYLLFLISPLILSRLTGRCHT